MKATLERLNVWAAATELRLHPYLLLKCIKYQARKNGGMKLPARSENGQSYFFRSELLAFDLDLRQPWVASKDDQRPPIPEYFTDLLRHEADFTCALCGSPLSTDFAHIEPWEACLHHHPHNLICLCGSCHRGYDTEKRITRESIEVAKAGLIHRLIRYLQGKSMASLGNYGQLADLCRKIHEYLTENHVAFCSFGPESQLAQELASADVADVWHRLRRETVLPNNDVVSRLLLTHRALYDGDDEFAHLADRFVAHAASYKAFVAEPNETHTSFRFPSEFATRVKEVADGKRQ